MPQKRTPPKKTTPRIRPKKEIPTRKKERVTVPIKQVPTTTRKKQVTPPKKRTTTVPKVDRAKDYHKNTWEQSKSSRRTIKKPASSRTQISKTKRKSIRKKN